MTGSSRQLARELHTGAAQIALTSIDNVIAYVEGQGEEPLGAPADFFAFMGLDDGLLSLMARPEINSIKALKGKTLAVDALTTGFAFVLLEILAVAGIGCDDITFTPVGTGAQRYSALLDGTCDATLLNAPISIAAENAGMRPLAHAREIVGEYQGVVGAARRSWALQNTSKIAAFIRGFRSSMRWLAKPTNKDTACVMLADKLPLIAPVVERAYSLLVTNKGLARELEIDLDGVKKVLALRNRHGRGVSIPVEPSRYLADTSLVTSGQN